MIQYLVLLKKDNYFFLPFYEFCKLNLFIISIIHNFKTNLQSNLAN